MINLSLVLMPPNATINAHLLSQ